MNKIFHRSLMAALLWIGLAALPNSASATHSWGNYHWARTSNPFTLKLGDNVSSAWDSYLATASSNWTDSTVMNTAIVAGAGGNPRRCTATTGRVEVCNTTYGNNGWLGVASIWASGSHIVKGTVKLNDTYFKTATYNTPAWRQMVMCQEIGHTFGLDHQDENFANANLGTCMDYTSDPLALASPPLQVKDNQSPNQHDYDELVTIYTHPDSTTTVGQTVQSGPGKGQMPSAFTDTDSDEPVQLGTAQWGKLVRSTNHGRTEVFELDLGRGQKMVTFVIWAD